jgi:hypothetical protein
VRPPVTFRVAGEPCPARDREGHGDGLRVVEPAPDDHRRGPGQWPAGEMADRRARAQSDGGQCWTRTTVKPGDVITGTGYQFADGQKIIRLERVVLADGREIRVYGR